MRTASRGAFGRGVSDVWPRSTRANVAENPVSPSNPFPFALIQAALPKAALTNAMLDDIPAVFGIAGASRSGACFLQTRFSFAQSSNPTQGPVLFWAKAAGMLSQSYH